MGKVMLRINNQNWGDRRRMRRGVAIVPALLIVSGLAIFTMALMTATLSGNKTLRHQSDDYKISSAVESTAMLAMEELWTGYMVYLDQNNLPQSIGNFQQYMDLEGIPDDADTYDADGDGIVELIPGATEGTSRLNEVGLPVANGNLQVNNVNIDAVQIVRVDLKPSATTESFDRTQVFLTVSASTTRGATIVNPIQNRAVQQVYTVEPEAFDGFDYAMLSNNVNCIFCHTNVDSVERYYNKLPGNYNSFDKVRVGTLESLMIRHNKDGWTAGITDGDADSFIAGTLYTRGNAVLHDGTPISSWSDMSLMGYEFDPLGKIMQTGAGNLILDPLAPAGFPLAANENLYLNYPLLEEDQVDGTMPAFFPAPIPDDGGIEPSTGLPAANAAGNRIIDDAEYAKVAANATGAITAGIVNVAPHGETIDTPAKYAAAVLTGNETGIQQSVDGNVILTGSYNDPIRIDGTVAIDGDVIIEGWIQGEGSIVARGNIYIPTDLAYKDGVDADGDRTFGSNNGYKNAVGLTAGGNVVIGDFQRPASIQPNGTWQTPGKLDYISGDPSGQWSFAMAEMAIFNRGEWSKTQVILPGAGEDTHDPSTWTVVNPDNRTSQVLPGPGENINDPTTWTMPNPSYDENFVPRYYGYKEGSIIPIHNKANPSRPGSQLYYDPSLRTWVGDEEAISWNTNALTYADPNDPSDPILYPAGQTQPAQVTISPQNDWISPDIYQFAQEYYNDNRGPLDDQPMLIDGLLYTNNAIFSMVNRTTNMKGRMVVNGALVAADLAMLVPGLPGTHVPVNMSPLGNYSIGLQLNYDQRVRNLLNVTNPFRVILKRTYWNPTSNVL